MAVLGKRKAADKSLQDDDGKDASAINDIFRRHFEARFQPLAPAQDGAASGSGAGQEDDDGEEDRENDEWGGLSDSDAAEDDDEDDDDDKASEVSEESSDDDSSAVEVVDHSSAQPPKPTAMSKRELKAFMSSRPPDHTAASSSTDPSSASYKPADPSSKLPEDAPSLLAQDLELRRLISESHLLAPSTNQSLSSILSSSSPANAPPPRTFTQGRTRQKATDMRVQALGSRDSILTQEKMPMHMRKGIVAAAGEREAKRRKQARENGIVLEREVGGGGKNKSRKRTGHGPVDRPGVGRLRGAELKLSDRDVKSIEGGRDAFGRRSKR